ncbi:MAG: hypothetical protein R3E12_20410 [Candidatus Eisenbacteria bacterium]
MSVSKDPHPGPYGSHRRDRVRRRLSAAVLVLSLTWQVAGAPAWAQTGHECDDVIETSLRSYQDGLFDRAIAALDHCLRNEGIASDRRAEAYHVLGLCHLAKDESDRARIAVHQLLLLSPAWEPDPLNDPPAFHRMIADVRKEMSEGRLVSPLETTETKKRNRWWILGSLAAAGGALAVVLLSGGDDESPTVEDLPEPPALPEP